MITKYNYILILVFLLFAKITYCQNDSIDKKIWGNAGVIIDNKDRIGFQLGFNYNMNKNIFSIRYYQNDEVFVGFPFKEPKLDKIKEIKNLSFLYGLSFGNKYFNLMPMAGVSIGQGKWRNNNVDTIQGNGWFSFDNYIYHYDKFQYLGLFLNLNLIWTPTKYFGFGIDIFENFHLHSDNGIIISIIFGNFRMKTPDNRHLKRKL